MLDVDSSEPSEIGCQSCLTEVNGTKGACDKRIAVLAESSSSAQQLLWSFSGTGYIIIYLRSDSNCTFNAAISNSAPPKEERVESEASYTSHSKNNR